MTSTQNLRLKILIIDDDEIVLDLLDNILGEDYHVEKWSCVLDGLQSLHVNKPDLILLDINLGEACGIDTARMIKLDPQNQDIPIIFISGFTSEEDQAACHEAGAVDFIAKPFTDQEVLRKARLHTNFQTIIDERNKIIDEAREASIVNFLRDAEIDPVLSFVHDSFKCESYEEISRRIFDFMENQKLKVAICIKSFDTSFDPLYFSCEGEISEVDKVFFYSLSGLERIIDVGERSLFNYENISILVQNMPATESELNSRIKNNVCLILEAANAKVASLNTELSWQKYHKEIVSAVDSSRKLLNNVETCFQRNARKSAKIIRQFKEKTEWSFSHLELSDKQKLEINTMIDKVEKDSIELYNSDWQMEERIEHLMGQLEKLSELPGKAK